MYNSNCTIVSSYVCYFIDNYRTIALTPSQQGTYIFKDLCHTGTFCTICKDNRIVERRLGMTIEV